jgi:DNA polymerase delta subunit 1
MKYEFQCISWIAKDMNEDDEDSGEEESDSTKQYKISIFGRCNNGNSICVHTHFFPYFFVEVPDKWTENSLDFINFRKSIKSIYSAEIKNVKLVNRKKFFGFTNGQSFKFARIDFKTQNAFKRMSYVLKKPFKYSAGKVQRFNIYEANLDPMLRFCHIQDIQLAGWASVETNNCIEVDQTTHCTTEIFVPNWRDVKHEAIEKIAPIVQASFDIETYSFDGSFPDPNEERCPCIQIATTLQRYGESEPYKKQLISLGTCDPIENVEVIECKTEKRVLETWGKLIRDEDVDILIGYNIWGFDLQYMFKRAKRTDAKKFFELGRYIGKKSERTDASFSSGAYGDSDYEMVDTLGRFQIDLLVIMKREYKLRKYSLNFVAEHFLGDQKVDMPYKEMFKKYKGNSKDRHDIGVYCVKDTDLPLRLINKLAILPNLIEMSKATWVPLSFLIERGQGIKVFSQICYTTRKANMLVISPNKDIWVCSACEYINNVKVNNKLISECKQCQQQKPEEEPYEGATVLSAMRGSYMDDPITGLDFASLYPTIMRAHNLCHSTFVMSKVYDNIPGVNYAEFGGCKFVQDSEGILPLMLRVLAENRKKAKKEMAAAKAKNDTFMESVFNGKQLAFKVSMNSIYGFCGAVVGFLPCKQVASTTTSIGRQMIEQTKNLAEKWYPGSVVVYGDTDSVMTKFNCGDLKGKDAIKKSFELGEEAAARISATFKAPIELEFEKVYYPYLLFSKKRYAGLMYTKPDKPDYIDAKGIQLVRRDNCPYVSKVSNEVLNSIMYSLNTEEAINIAKRAAEALLTYQVPINELIVSKSLRRIGYIKEKKNIPPGKKSVQCDGFYLTHEYANSNLPHITVARKREERDPGTGPKSGDRVPYVFIDTKNPKDLQYLKAEDPDFAIENNLKPDVQYYLEHGLSSPLVSLMEVFIDNPKETLFSTAVNKFNKKKNYQLDIYEYLGITHI